MKSRQPEFTTRRYQEIDKGNCQGLWRELIECHREIYDDPTIGGKNPEDYFDRHPPKSDRTKSELQSIMLWLSGSLGWWSKMRNSQ